MPATLLQSRSLPHPDCGWGVWVPGCAQLGSKELAVGDWRQTSLADSWCPTSPEQLTWQLSTACSGLLLHCWSPGAQM